MAKSYKNNTHVVINKSYVLQFIASLMSVRCMNARKNEKQLQRRQSKSDSRGRQLLNKLML